MVKTVMPLAIVAALSIAGAGPLKAAAAENAVRVPRVAAAGLGDAAVWQKAPAVSGFRSLLMGAPAASKTECRLAHTETALVVRCTAFQNLESVQDGVLSATSQTGDYMALSVIVGTDVEHAQQHLYYISPKGRTFTMGTTAPPRGWSAVVTTTPISWTATFTVPFATGGSACVHTSWRIAVLRNAPSQGGPAVWPYDAAAQPLSWASSKPLVFMGSH